MSVPENPVNDFIPQIHTAVEEWLSEQSPAQLRREIRSRLDKSRNEILMKLMGFDKSYGNAWKIDHCNGRAEGSLAGRALKECVGEEVKAWLQDVGLPQLTEAETTQLKKTLHTEYLSTMARELRAVVRTRAKQDLDTLIEQAIPAPAIEQYLAAHALITDI